MLRKRCGGALAPLLTLCLALGATSLPIGEDGPHLNHGWGDPARLRHLFSRGSLYLSIDSDGTVAGTATHDLNCKYCGGLPCPSPASPAPASLVLDRLIWD